MRNKLFLGALLVGTIISASDSFAGGTVQGVATTKTPSGFRVDKKFYPSNHNPNFLPNGTLVKKATNNNVYQIRDGKTTLILNSILDRWLGENHFFKRDIIRTISTEDFARYPQGNAVNKIYVGKVLKGSSGKQYFIDDKMRKRELSTTARATLKFPANNLYATTDAHLTQFSTGKPLDGKSIPGGFVFYDGHYHGGRMWKTTEAGDGKIEKHLYLKDRFYEADGNPDESQRVALSSAQLATLRRGVNIDKYPDGWFIGIGKDVYLMQGGKRRKIASPEILNAMSGANQARKEYPEIFTKYATGEDVRAFKNTIAPNTNSSTTSGAKSAPNTAHNLTRVRPEIRALIADMNNIFMSVFDRDPSVNDNQFWVDYAYNGEVKNKAELLNAMKGAKKSGNNPARTPLNAELDSSVLENKWFPYFFYFTHQRDANEDEKDYWFNRINTDKNTPEKLGGTIQWLKDTQGRSMR
jgi:hypothetical protein